MVPLSSIILNKIAFPYVPAKVSFLKQNPFFLLKLKWHQKSSQTNALSASYHTNFLKKFIVRTDKRRKLSKLSINTLIYIQQSYKKKDYTIMHSAM